MHTDLRLTDGYSNYSGRVEIFSYGQWSTICDDDLDDNDAKVSDSISVL